MIIGMVSDRNEIKIPNSFGRHKLEITKKPFDILLKYKTMIMCLTNKTVIHNCRIMQSAVLSHILLLSVGKMS